MQHDIWFEFADNALYPVPVANIGTLKTHLRLSAHPIEILMRAPTRQIIEQCNGPAALMEMQSGIHADETGASSDQNRVNVILLRAKPETAPAARNQICK